MANPDARPRKSTPCVRNHAAAVLIAIATLVTAVTGLLKEI